MSIFDRKPALRWLAPLAAVAVVGGAGGVVALTATADSGLTPISAQQLLVDVQKAKVDALSGTVVQDSNLGLPNLPGVGGTDSASLTSLVSGTHTLQVWYSGPDKARLRVQGKLDESDVIVNGKDVWNWSYKGRSATHRTLTADATSKAGNKAGNHAGKQPQLPADAPKTPEDAASKFLAAVGPTTNVTTDGTGKVAGQDVYQLVLTPKVHDSLVKKVRIAVDGKNFIPLRVQVFGTDAKPAFEVGYTQVSFARPDDSRFKFNPPKGTKVTEVAPDTTKAHVERTPRDQQAKKAQSKLEQQRKANQPKVFGTGWSTVVVSKVGLTTANQSSGSQSSGSQSSGQLNEVLSRLPKVSGKWGSGRLFKGAIFTAVLTDDGRVAVGSVAPDALYKALGK